MCPFYTFYNSPLIDKLVVQQLNYNFIFGLDSIILTHYWNHCFSNLLESYTKITIYIVDNK